MLVQETRSLLAHRYVPHLPEMHGQAMSERTEHALALGQLFDRWTRGETHVPDDWPSDLPRPRGGFRQWAHDRFLEGYLPQTFHLIERSNDRAPGWCYRCPTCQTLYRYLPAAEFEAITSSPLSSATPGHRRIVCSVCLPRLMGKATPV